MSEIKQCHACGEEIKTIAKRCSHCQTWQSKWRFESNDPKFQIFWLFIVIGVFWLLFSNIGLFGRENFQGYADSLIITESKLNYGTNSCGSFISVIGKIKNESDIAWENLHFEIQYYDSENELIDTVSDNDYELVVLPHSESTFKARGKADKNKEAYKNHSHPISS